MPTPNQSEDAVSVDRTGQLKVNLLRIVILLLVLITSGIGLAGKFIYADLSQQCAENRIAATSAAKTAADVAVHAAVVDEKIFTIQRTMDKIDANVTELLRRTK